MNELPVARHLPTLLAILEEGRDLVLSAPPGGGKSTMVQMLTGLYTPQSGSILFNGQNLLDVGVDQIRKITGVILQSPGLFHASIRDNILMGEDRSDEEIWQALEVACLADFVTDLPEGLDAAVGKGLKLSGGQRQRVAIARMVIQKPEIVILDEATSALDPETETQVLKNLRSFLQNRTTITIAHRLSAIKQADIIHVFENGSIIQNGRHDELINQSGIYSKLYRQKGNFP